MTSIKELIYQEGQQDIAPKRDLAPAEQNLKVDNQSKTNLDEAQTKTPQTNQDFATIKLSNAPLTNQSQQSMEVNIPSSFVQQPQQQDQHAIRGKSTSIRDMIYSDPKVQEEIKKDEITKQVLAQDKNQMTAVKNIEKPETYHPQDAIADKNLTGDSDPVTRYNQIKNNFTPIQKEEFDRKSQGKSFGEQVILAEKIYTRKPFSFQESAKTFYKSAANKLGEFVQPIGGVVGNENSIRKEALAQIEKDQELVSGLREKAAKGEKTDVAPEKIDEFEKNLNQSTMKYYEGLLGRKFKPEELKYSPEELQRKSELQQLQSKHRLAAMGGEMIGSLPEFMATSKIPGMEMAGEIPALTKTGKIIQSGLHGAKEMSQYEAVIGGTPEEVEQGLKMGFGFGATFAALPLAWKVGKEAVETKAAETGLTKKLVENGFEEKVASDISQQYFKGNIDKRELAHEIRLKKEALSEPPKKLETEQAEPELKQAVSGEKFQKKETPLETEAKKYDSPEAFFEARNQGEKLIPESERPVVYSADIEGISRGKEPYRVQNDIGFVSNGDEIVAMKNGKEVGYVTKMNGDQIDLTVAKDFQNQGVGKELIKEYLNKNPEMIYRAKGFTEAGKKNFISAVREIYPKFQKEGLKSSERILEVARARELRRPYLANPKNVEGVFEIRTPDGGKAHGRYNDGVIQISNLAKSTTGRHEAFHWFVDKFADKKLYEKASEEIKAKHGINDSLGIEEHLAEQFAEYAQKKLAPRGLRGTVRRLFDQIISTTKKAFGGNKATKQLFDDFISGKGERKFDYVPEERFQRMRGEEKKSYIDQLFKHRDDLIRNELYLMRQEVEHAKAGERIRIEQNENVPTEGNGIIGVKSTFPKWFQESKIESKKEFMRSLNPESKKYGELVDIAKKRLDQGFEDREVGHIPANDSWLNLKDKIDEVGSKIEATPKEVSQFKKEVRQSQVEPKINRQLAKAEKPAELTTEEKSGVKIIEGERKFPGAKRSIREAVGLTRKEEPTITEREALKEKLRAEAKSSEVGRMTGRKEVKGELRQRGIERKERVEARKEILKYRPSNLERLAADKKIDINTAELIKQQMDDIVWPGKDISGGVREVKRLKSVIEKAQREGKDISFLPEKLRKRVLEQKSIPELSTAELKAKAEKVNKLFEESKRKQKLKKEQEKLDRAAIEEDLNSELKKSVVGSGKEKRGFETHTFKERFGNGLLRNKLNYAEARTVLQAINGGLKGKFYKYFFELPKELTRVRDTWMKQNYDDFSDALLKFAEEKKYNFGEVKKYGDIEISNNAKLKLLQHAQNEDDLMLILQNQYIDGKKITFDHIQKMFDSLTPVEEEIMERAQKFYTKAGDDLGAKYKEVENMPMKRVEGVYTNREIETGQGKYGGDDIDFMLEQNGLVRPSTEKGMTKQRVSHGKEFNLDFLGSMDRHADKVSRYIAYAKDAPKILGSLNDISQNLTRKFGSSTTNYVKEYLHDVMFGIKNDKQQLERNLSKLRNMSYSSIQFANIKMVLNQLSGIFNSVAKIGWGDTLAGLKEAAKPGRKLYDEIADESIFMHNRSIDPTRKDIMGVREQEKLFSKNKKLNAPINAMRKAIDVVKEKGLAPIGHVDRFGAGGMYWGAKLKYLREHPGDEAGAIRFAEDMVSEIQPMSSDIYMTQGARHDPIFKLLHMFSTQRFQILNDLSKDYIALKNGNISKGKMAHNLIYNLVLPSVSMALITSLGAKKGLDLAGDTIQNLIGILPFVGETVSSVQYNNGKVTVGGVKPFEYAIRTGMDFSNAVKHILDGDDEKFHDAMAKGIWDALETTGTVTGISFRQFKTAYDAYSDSQLGDDTRWQRYLVAKGNLPKLED